MAEQYAVGQLEALKLPQGVHPDDPVLVGAGVVNGAGDGVAVATLAHMLLEVFHQHSGFSLQLDIWRYHEQGRLRHALPSAMQRVLGQLAAVKDEQLAGQHVLFTPTWQPFHAHRVSLPTKLPQVVESQRELLESIQYVAQPGTQEQLAAGYSRQTFHLQVPWGAEFVQVAVGHVELLNSAQLGYAAFAGATAQKASTTTMATEASWARIFGGRFVLVWWEVEVDFWVQESSACFGLFPQGCRNEGCCSVKNNREKIESFARKWDGKGTKTVAGEM
jgi:hypothetical protein